MGAALPRVGNIAQDCGQHCSRVWASLPVVQGNLAESAGHPCPLFEFEYQMAYFFVCYQSPSPESQLTLRKDHVRNVKLMYPVGNASQKPRNRRRNDDKRHTLTANLELRRATGGSAGGDVSSVDAAPARRRPILN